LLKNGKESINW